MDHDPWSSLRGARTTRGHVEVSCQTDLSIAASVGVVVVWAGCPTVLDGLPSIMGDLARRVAALESRQCVSAAEVLRTSSDDPSHCVTLTSPPADGEASELHLLGNASSPSAALADARFASEREVCAIDSVMPSVVPGTPPSAALPNSLVPPFREACGADDASPSVSPASSAEAAFELRCFADPSVAMGKSPRATLASSPVNEEASESRLLDSATLPSAALADAESASVHEACAVDQILPSVVPGTSPSAALGVSLVPPFCDACGADDTSPRVAPASTPTSSCEVESDHVEAACELLCFADPSVAMETSPRAALTEPPALPLACGACDSAASPPSAAPTSSPASSAGDATRVEAALALRIPDSRLHPAGVRSSDLFVLPELEREGDESLEPSDWCVVGPRRRARRILRAFPAGAHPSDA